MIINNVLLIGGSGFIGASVAEQLSAQEIFVTVPTRRRERAKSRRSRLGRTRRGRQQQTGPEQKGKHGKTEKTPEHWPRRSGKFTGWARPA